MDILRRAKHDDYANLDVKGKIVLLVADGDPPNVDRSRLKDDESGEANARSHGAAGVISLPPRRYLRFMKSPQFKEMIAKRASVRLAKTVDGTLPTIMLAPDAADKFLALFGMKFEDVMDAASKGEAACAQGARSSANVPGRCRSHDIAEPERRRHS